MADLAQVMMASPDKVLRAIDALSIAKAVERVGDHATNIAEYVVFMSRGRDVRHESIEALEQAVRPAD
jgi:phosphate transport system protein